jgi:hypothetical protein
MTWRYQQSTGKLFNPAGDWIGTGYSGNGAVLDNPAAEAVVGHGPIPAGLWTIGPAETVPHLGPLAMALAPADGTDTFGRSEFFIHGDNAAMDHTASCGCIVLGRADRQQIAATHDRSLKVIP